MESSKKQFPKETVQYPWRCPREMKEDIEVIAASNGRSLNGQLNVIIHNYILRKRHRQYRTEIEVRSRKKHKQEGAS